MKKSLKSFINFFYELGTIIIFIIYVQFQKISRAVRKRENN